MTLSATSRRAGPFVGDDDQTLFPFSFKMFDEADVRVTIADEDGAETILVMNVDYSVSLNVNQDTSPGGSITYPITGDPLPDGHLLSITSAIDYDQPLDIPAGGSFNPVALENELDRVVMQIQQLIEMLERALLAPVTTDLNLILPPPIAGYLLGWNQSETGLTNYTYPDLASIAIYANWAYDTFTGNGTTTTFTLSGAPGNVANTDVTIDGQTMVPITDFSISGTSIIFVTAPANGTEILVRYGSAAAHAGQSEVFIVACSDEITALTTGTAKATFRMPYAMTLSEVRASLSTAQTSGSVLTVDINESGASILSTKLTIDNNERTSTTAAAPVVISDYALAADAEITIDIDQVGTSPKGLKVTFIGVRA